MKASVPTHLLVFKYHNMLFLCRVPANSVLGYEKQATVDPFNPALPCEIVVDFELCACAVSYSSISSV